jgi:hypothetical protein
MDNDVVRPGQQVSHIVAQLESADDDGLKHLLGKTREVLKLIIWLAESGDIRMKDVLPHVRAMARAIQRRDKGKAVQAGIAAVTEFGATEAVSDGRIAMDSAPPGSPTILVE